jgi:small-conductance mechanosensitive channel
MTFLEDVYLGNSILTWLIAVGVAILAFLCLLFLRKILRSRLHRLAKATETDLDDLVVDLIKRTKTILLLAIALFIGSFVLSLPERTSAIIARITTLVFLLQAGIWASAILVYLISRNVRQKMVDDPATATTISAMDFLAKMALWSVVLLLALENLGFDITALVAGLGVGGIAIALAVQNILSDLFASLSIVLDKPFVIGDFIIVDSLLGTVEHVGLKTTRLRSLSGEQLVFSNADLLRSRIRNYKRMFERRVVFTIGVTYQTPYEKLERIGSMIREIITAEADTRFDRAHFQAYGDSSLNFEVVYFVLKPDYNLYMDIQQRINLALYRKFEEEGIEFAYPTRTLYIQSQSSDKEAGRQISTVPSGGT